MGKEVPFRVLNPQPRRREGIRDIEKRFKSRWTSNECDPVLKIFFL